ncbi:HtaA domain-containing protein [Streptomyces sp. KCTC 0041BP]|uniref:HtaA domain-containing protein n=1 Tax=Streptomyces sp. KCTC 0041BP TaxID=201500 RepID=UPI001AE69221|nr:HtaA domain-containing protein [Streptomyces sp. KCTC 0041BP]MBP0934066.1 HtaA domain-containing protein [Streptomyces sp. KCTC 0041BP]
MSSPRRPVALAAAIATVAALGATAFVLPATAGAGAPAAAAAAPAAAPKPIVDGTLDWGLLERYRTYVEKTAKGTITTSDGATRNADGTFRLGSAAGQYDPGTNVVTAAFKGSVVFDASAHGFVVKLANFRIDTGTKKLTVDVTKNGVLTPNVAFADVAFAGPAMTKLETTLTKDAADQLGGPQYAGIKGDPLTVAVAFEAPGPTGSPSTSPAPTTSSSAPAPTTSPSKTASTPPADGPQPVLSGKLTWGIKESFRKYVQGAGGTVTPAGGAAASGPTFSFPAGKGELDVKKRKLSAAFEGNLRFQYAAHGIDMTFGNIKVAADGAKGTLVLDVKNASGTKTAVPFATLDLSKAEYKTKGGLLALGGVPTALTAEGAAAFANDTTGSLYKAGDRIDDVDLAVAVEKDVVLPTSTPTTAPTSTKTTGTTGATTGGGSVGGSGGGSAGGGGSVGGNLASTGAEIPAGALLGASGAVIAAGAGAVFLARRRRTAGN